MNLHPDRLRADEGGGGGVDHREQQFIQLNSAYELLQRHLAQDNEYNSQHGDTTDSLFGSVNRVVRDGDRGLLHFLGKDAAAVAAAAMSLFPSANDTLHSLLQQDPPRLAEALEELENMKSRGDLPNRMSYTMLIHGCAMAMPAEPPTPSSAAEGFTHALLDKALELYHEMKLERLQPSTDTLNALIIACGKAGQLERAWAIFEYMLEEGDALKLPNISTVNLLMREARRHGDHGRALSLLQRLSDINGQTIFRRVNLGFVTCSMLLHSAAEGQDGAHIARLPDVLKAMSDRHIRPDAAVWPKLATACLEHGKADTVAFIHAEMARQGVCLQPQLAARVESVLLKIESGSDDASDLESEKMQAALDIATFHERQRTKAAAKSASQAGR